MFPCTDRHFGRFLLRYRPDVAVCHAAFRRKSAALKPPVEEIENFVEPLDLPPDLFLSACVTEFVMVTAQFRELSEKRLGYQRNLSPGGWRGLSFAPTQWESISNIFCSTLHPILSPSRQILESVTISQNSTASELYTPDTTRLICLLHIHTMLWRYRDNPTQAEIYMLRIAHEIKRNGLGATKSLDALNWVLVWICLNSDGLHSDQDELGWKELTRLIARLMRVARCLSRRSWKILEYTLFESLGSRRPLYLEDLDATHELSKHREDEIKWLEPEVVWEESMAEPPSWEG